MTGCVVITEQEELFQIYRLLYRFATAKNYLQSRFLRTIFLFNFCRLLSLYLCSAVFMLKPLRSLFLTNRFFFTLGGLSLLFVLSYSFSMLFGLAKVLFWAITALTITDLLLLYRVRQGLGGRRITPDKLSNGDDNLLRIVLDNYYRFPTQVRLLDELPVQFQKRDFQAHLSIPSGQSHTYTYTVRPVKRGEYHFGAVNALVSSPIGLVRRRFRFSADKMVPVYPSYIQMRKYELLAISNRLTEFGIKKIRRIGHNQEFEQIKEYVAGDDYRTINWKATARRGSLMVNNYQDERSQQVYALIDKGRTMRMPFEGMSLLDYAINASLVICNIAIKKDDKAGLITFQHKVQTIVPASRRSKQMYLLMEALYNQKTAYQEADYSALYTAVRRRITQRSLLLLFTSFESLSSMERQLPYLRKLAREHLLVVIFFKNTELHTFLNQPVRSVSDVYQKTIAEKFAFEKKIIAERLPQFGIHAVLTTPRQLSVDTINQYLALKARGLI